MPLSGKLAVLKLGTIGRSSGRGEHRHRRSNRSRQPRPSLYDSPQFGLKPVQTEARNPGLILRCEFGPFSDKVGK